MDKQFRDFLIAKAETLKTQLTDPNLPVEEILDRAQEILRLEKRVERMDNPRTRKPKSEPAPTSTSE